MAKGRVKKTLKKPAVKDAAVSAGVGAATGSWKVGAAVGDARVQTRGFNKVRAGKRRTQAFRSGYYDKIASVHHVGSKRTSKISKLVQDPNYHKHYQKSYKKGASLASKHLNEPYISPSKRIKQPNIGTRLRTGKRKLR